MKTATRIGQYETLRADSTHEMVHELLDRVLAVETASALESVKSPKYPEGLTKIPPLLRAELVYLGMDCGMHFLLAEVANNGPDCLRTDAGATAWIEDLWVRGGGTVPRLPTAATVPGRQSGDTDRFAIPGNARGDGHSGKGVSGRPGDVPQE
jgi:hypothetical protein